MATDIKPVVNAEGLAAISSIFYIVKSAVGSVIPADSLDSEKLDTIITNKILSKLKPENKE